MESVYRGAYRRVTSAKTASEQPPQTRSQAHVSPFPYALPVALCRQIDITPLRIMPDAEAMAYPPLLPG